MNVLDGPNAIYQRHVFILRTHRFLCLVLSRVILALVYLLRRFESHSSHHAISQVSYQGNQVKAHHFISYHVRWLPEIPWLIR